MKKIGIIAGILVVVMGFVVLILPSLVNREAVKTAFVQSIKNATGTEPVILGDVSASFFPTPSVTIQKIGIKNAAGALSPYIIQFQSVELFPVFSQAFSGTPQIERIVINEPTVELETLADGNLNWKMAFPSVKSFYRGLFDLSKIKTLQIPNVQINGATVRYVSQAIPQAMKLEYLNGSFTHSDSGMMLDVNGQYKNTPLQITGNLNFTAENAGAPLDITIKAVGSNLSAKSEIKNTGAETEIAGELSFASEDLFTLSRFLKGASADLSSVSNSQKIPLSLALKFHHSGTVFDLTDVKLEAPFVKAASSLKTDITSGESTMNLDIDSIDLDALRESHVISLFQDSHTESVSDDAGKDKPSRNDESTLDRPLIGLTEDQTLALAMQAKRVTLNGQPLTDLVVDAEFSGAFADINSAKIKLPGNSEVTMMGTVKNGFQGVTFEGTLDSWGQNIVELMPVFKLDKTFLPPADFKRFRFKSDQVVFSPLEARFIDLRMQVENIAVVGTVIGNYKDDLRIESTLLMRGLNLDHFISQHASSLESTDKDKSVYISALNRLAIWLKTVSGYHATRVTLEQFTLNGEVREKADVELKLSPTKFDLSKLSLFYNGSNINAALSVENIAGVPLPKFRFKVEADQIDTAAITGEKQRQEPVDASGAQPALMASGELPRDEFAVYWLDDVDLTFEFKFGSFTHKNWHLQNVSAKGSVLDRALTFDPIRLRIWGADTAAKLTLTGGKLPLLGAAFTLNNVSMEQLRQITPLFNGMEGKLNVNGVLSTSGVSPYFLVSNLSGKLGIAGRDVLVKGFNLRGIVRSVSAVRSVADILNVVRLAFPGGDTNLNTVQGNFNIANGKLQTSGISITTNEASGFLLGDIDLVKWNMNTNINFDLSTLDASNPPALRVLFSGDLERPQKNLDTKSLEEFVALKTKEKYLQSSPAGQ